jgi:adenylate cyclase
MSDQAMERRLAAILAADVASYTRLMEEDTDGTVAAWRAARDDVIEPLVQERSGRIVKLTGDGFLVEFPTMQDAVNCAIALQQSLAASSLDFRMGINLGDIIDDGRDIHGEGVNVAARLEGLAEPGGICISGGVFDQVRNRIEAVYEDMGPQQVKNVSAPVQAYALRFEAIAVAVIDVEEEKPSIAVLPFDNMSGDADQESFADGMTEDLITDLSKISGLFVVARNSSFIYKGQGADVRKVAEELGVRYVLEGSVRRAGDKVRINAQLIDSQTGGHLWADRYDGSVDNVFELQDEVSAKVVEALSVQLTRGEADSLKRVHTSNLEAYELYIRARATPYPPVPNRINSAREMFEQVIEMDPNFAGGYAGVAMMLCFGSSWSFTDRTEDVERAFNLAERAIKVDETFGWSYTAKGFALMHQKQFEQAISAAGEAVVRQPSDADAHAYLEMFLGLVGKSEDGVKALEQAISLNPQFIGGPYLNQLGQTYLLSGDYEKGVEALEENVRCGGPVGPPAICWGSAALMGAGREEEAREFAARIGSNYPEFVLDDWNMPNLIADVATRAQFVDLMRAAGIP